jgi:AcrR family transcriptional regulator
MTRRDRNAEATRRDILTAGRELFAARPYSEVSGLEICARAGVTRGALQHHFGSKLGLFMAVFERLQNGVIESITEAVGAHVDPWAQARAGIAAFLQACTESDYQAVVLKEGPAAIGWQHWRELDGDYFGDIVNALIDTLAAVGLADHPPALLAATIRGTLTELSFEIAQSADQAAAQQQALAVVDRLLSSFNASPPTHFTAPSSGSGVGADPTRIGLGQLRASAGAYLDRVEAGETIEVLRRGRRVAQLKPIPVDGE